MGAAVKTAHGAWLSGADAKSKRIMPGRTEQLLADCRRFRADLMQTVSELKAAREGRSISRAELKMLDERIFNCECSIARFEIVIMETEAGGSALPQSSNSKPASASS